MRQPLLAALVFGGALGLATNASAIDWTLGAGAGVKPDYEGSSDYEPTPLLFLRAQDLYHKRTFVNIAGPKIKSNLLPHDNIRLGVSAEYIFKRDDVDNRPVDNLPNANSGTMLGLVLGYQFRFENKRSLTLELDGRYDLRDNIGGLFTGGVDFSTPLANNLSLNIGADTTYATEDYMENFFGVTQEGNAASGLSVYSPDAGFKDVGLNTRLTYRFNETWSMSGLANYKRLVGDADDSSPVTDEGSENQFFGGLTVNVRF